MSYNGWTCNGEGDYRAHSCGFGPEVGRDPAPFEVNGYTFCSGECLFRWVHTTEEKVKNRKALLEAALRDDPTLTRKNMWLPLAERVRQSKVKSVKVYK